ncbi:MAG: class I SAM-dependent methyltransferase [Candidatus Brocadiaceae bacterium]|nr:class I SAM-dependent methyltransferase [Candidatus Brocadiaceae bacterium]
MGIYDRYLLPHIIHLGCGAETIRAQRKKVVPLAEGRVVEIGMGSGLNLPYYDTKKVDVIWGIEPSEGMRKKARKNLGRSAIKVRWLSICGEEIPLGDNSADTILLTYTLCTIPDWHTALRQMYRILTFGGKLLFCEHGVSPDASILAWQNRINPVWRKLCGGCHLNRPIPEYIEKGGFHIQTMETHYLPKVPRVAGFHYVGIAKKV